MIRRTLIEEKQNKKDADKTNEEEERLKTLKSKNFKQTTNYNCQYFDFKISSPFHHPLLYPTSTERGLENLKANRKLRVVTTTTTPTTSINS